MRFRLLTNILSNILISIRYNNRKNPFKEFKRLVSKPTPGNNLISNKNILLVPFRVDPASNLFEGMVGKFLLNKGYSVDALVCGQAVNMCDHLIINKNHAIRCSMCFKEQKAFESSFSINNIYLTELLNNSERKQIKDEVDDINLDQLEGITRHGVSIYSHLYFGMQRYFTEINPNFYDNEKITREFITTIFITLDAMVRKLNEKQYTCILMSHGIYSTWGPLLDLFTLWKIPITIWGRTYKNGEIQASHNASYLFSNMHEPVDTWEKCMFTEEQEKELKNYMDSRNPKNSNANKFLDYESYYSKGINKTVYSNSQIRTSLQIPENDKILSIFTNIPWDGQAFGATECYPKMKDWLIDTFNWAKNKNNLTLLIRIHPAESTRFVKTRETFLDYIEKEKIELSYNSIIIHADSKYDSYSIANISNGCLMYFSTIGLELAYMGKIVITAGQGFYSKKKLVLEPSTKIEYISMLNNLYDGKINVDKKQIERIKRYCYHFYFRRNMKESLIEFDHNLRFKNYLFNNEESFFNNKEINEFTEKMLSGNRFIFSD